MTNNQNLYSGIGKAAWGYFFIYFNFNINTVNILPSFVGYLLFLSAINYLCEEQKELDLLRTPVTILIGWHIISWLASLVSVDISGIFQAADIIISVVNIYFHFQLLTNLAFIAKKHQPEGYSLDERLLQYRTLQTILLTAVVVLGYFTTKSEDLTVFVSICIIIIYLIVSILLMKALFNLRRCFKKDSENIQPDV